MRKGICKITLICLFILPVILLAEVKLRIYMDDGTLQAGNLINETEKAFVLLTREGRVEVPKKRIMFVNGKTLQQWENRPDKLYQTEIIPAEVPNPVYVTEKVKDSLPKRVPPITGRTVEKPVVKPDEPLPPPPNHEKVETKPSSPKPAAKRVEKPVPAKPSPPVAPVVSKKPKPKKKEAGIPSTRKIRLHKSKRRKRLAGKKALVKPRKFLRKAYGNYHLKRAKAFLREGQKGRAIQELHKAVTLNRWKAESALLLGKLYMEEGVNRHAKVYLQRPALKKNKEVPVLLKKMADDQKKAEQDRLILFGAAGAGFLAWVPLVLIVRRLQRKKSRVRVVVADDVALETAKPSVLGPSVLGPSPFADDLLKGEKERPLDVLPELPVEVPVKEAIPTPLVEAKVEAPAPESSSPEPPPPPVEPVRDRGDGRSPEPMAPPPPPQAPPPPPAVTPAFLAPVEPSPDRAPRPEEEPPAPPLALDHEEIIARGHVVDQAVQKGNQHCAEGRLDLAERQYRTAVVLDETSVDGYLGLAFVSFGRGQWELALEYYVRVLSIDPNSPDAHYGIGRVLIETEQVDQAVPELQKTLMLDPSFTDARDTLTLLGKAA